ncbi:MAG: hypothetical protein R2749_30435 [Acidimicrobiales bacterium]
MCETSLVDFAPASGDRLGTIAAQSGDVVEALIPNEHLPCGYRPRSRGGR